jgi:large conductance mechanosensitive channel
MTIFKEFKTFISRGNVVDLAVGVIIGAAFGKIVTSLVSDIIMPPIGIIAGGVNFTSLKVTLTNTIDSTGRVTPVTLNYGSFIQTTVDFIIIAFSIFLFVKLFNTLKRKEEVEQPPPPPTNEEKLLTEIRDILKGRNSK